MVSVLFSEPKIPQLNISSSLSSQSSAFQCSSASRKFLNNAQRLSALLLLARFSALQRAENSSILGCGTGDLIRRAFQCSSASRKFLNRHTSSYSVTTTKFQCSSASRKFLNAGESSTSQHAARVSVLFSEPKIPQWDRVYASEISACDVSVLFSEPKIPQFSRTSANKSEL